MSAPMNTSRQITKLPPETTVETNVDSRGFRSSFLNRKGIFIMKNIVTAPSSSDIKFSHGVPGRN